MQLASRTKIFKQATLRCLSWTIQQTDPCRRRTKPADCQINYILSDWTSIKSLWCLQGFFYKFGRLRLLIFNLLTIYINISPHTAHWLLNQEDFIYLFYFLYLYLNIIFHILTDNTTRIPDQHFGFHTFDSMTNQRAENYNVHWWTIIRKSICNCTMSNHWTQVKILRRALNAP